MAKTAAFELEQTYVLSCPILGCLWATNMHINTPFLSTEKLKDVKTRNMESAEALFNIIHSRMTVHIKENHSE